MSVFCGVVATVVGGVEDTLLTTIVEVVSTGKPLKKRAILWLYISLSGGKEAHSHVNELLHLQLSTGSIQVLLQSVSFDVFLLARFSGVSSTYISDITVVTSI